MGIRSSGPCDVDGHRSAALVARAARFTRFCPRAPAQRAVWCDGAGLSPSGGVAVGARPDARVMAPPTVPAGHRADVLMEQRSSGAERLPHSLFPLAEGEEQRFNWRTPIDLTFHMYSTFHFTQEIICSCHRTSLFDSALSINLQPRNLS
jgi:hypothetical protein